MAITLILILCTIIFGLLNREKVSQSLLWAVVLSAWISFIYCLVDFGLDFFAMRGNLVCKNLSSILNRAALILIDWMAYAGTGWIDIRLTTDQFFVLKVDATFWFWASFTAIVVIKGIMRKLTMPRCR